MTDNQKNPRLSEINDILSLGEGFTIEFKRSVTSDIGREICAFANASGGAILVGVGNDGKIHGVSDHNRVKSEIQSVARSADPPVTVEIESADKIIVVRVPSQSGKPFSFGGKFFMREGASTQQMSREEIREFFYSEGLIHFDETGCEEFSLENDLDEENWRLFRQRAKIPENMEPETALQNLHLLTEDGHVTRAGTWLLAKDIRRFRISGDVSCALFMGTEKVRILDRRDFNRDVYSMINETVAWILSKINVEYIIKHVKREERPELPEEALREAVVNAFAHRDYRSTANIQVYVFKDRVEIVSPGGLPAGMTEQGLGTRSIPRNPLLFALLHRMEMVEKIGSGIRRIRDMCKEYGVAEPVIEVSDFWVTVTFTRPDIEQSTNQVGTKSAPSRHQVGTKSAPSRHQVEVLQNCVSEKPITEIMSLRGRIDRTKFRRQMLKPLIDAGLLEMTIPGKPTSSRQKYRLTEKGRDVLAEMGISADDRKEH